MKISKPFKLSAYTSMSVCFLKIATHAHGQIVYHDFDPDIVIDEPGVSEELDLDGNGFADFSFLNSSFTFYSPGHDSYRNRLDILAKPLNSLNAIAGTYDYIHTFYGGGWWYYPYALAYNSVIDAFDQWQNHYHQILALITIDFEDGDIHYAPDADWFNSNISETIDHYLGIRFVDSENQNHYGWIRCDVIDSGKTLVIKDYAYNETVDNGIYAGTLIGAFPEGLDIYWTVYAFDHQLYVYVGTPQTEDFKFRIFDINGSLMFSSHLMDKYSTFDLKALAAGVYLVEIQSSMNRYTKKIFLP